MGQSQNIRCTLSVRNCHTQSRSQKSFREGKVWWNQKTQKTSKVQEKMTSQGKRLKFFFYILLKIHFERKIYSKDEHNLLIFPKIRALFSLFKKGQERCPPSPLKLGWCYLKLAKFSALSYSELKT